MVVVFTATLTGKLHLSLHGHMDASTSCPKGGTLSEGLMVKLEKQTFM
jgi:hypothetical protein